MKCLISKQTTPFLLWLILILLGNKGGCQQNAYFFEKQEITVHNFPAIGYILDIGGGGAGVIGQLKGEQVIAIDPLEQELIDAPSNNLKIVMDGRELKFINGSFNTATSFFTMMYINGSDHEKVFKEVFRVLKHGGRFLVWDVNLPIRPKDAKILSFPAYRFTFTLPKTIINTGYGTHWPSKEQNLDYYKDIAQKIGFKVINSTKTKYTFFLELQTPVSIGETIYSYLKKTNTQEAIKEYYRLKNCNKDELYFGTDAFVSLYLKLLSEEELSESLEMFKLADKEFGLTEQMINSFGYILLGKRKNMEAVEVFKINIKKFPESANAYDSLAEAYMESGNKDEAIKNYEKSIDLNPSNSNAKSMLEKLRSK